MDELQEELTIDFDIGYAIKDNVIPRAVEWFTGEIAPFPEDEYGEYDEDEGDA
jgi:nucleosome assembly protein 1-like 1